MQVWLTVAMFAMISEMYDDHHKKQKTVDELGAEHFKAGILKTPTLHPSQIYNGDEIGFDPTGKW